MSRVGIKPIQIPDKVEVMIGEGSVRVKGPKGELTQAIEPVVSVKKEPFDGTESVVVSVAHPDEKHERAMWGTTRALIAGMIKGVTEGFSKQLEVVGVGYRVNVQGKKLVLEVGFSHPVDFELPEGIAAAVDKNIVTLSGISKQIVGETAARIRRIRLPEPYKGKGIKFIDEVVRRKAGKAAKATTAA